MILKLSTKPIVRRVERRRGIRKTNWDAFKGKMEERVNTAFNLAELENREDIDADKLEDLYKRWYEAIESSLEETSPLTKLSYYIHVRDSDCLKLQEIAYRNMTRRKHRHAKEYSAKNEGGKPLPV